MTAVSENRRQRAIWAALVVSMTATPLAAQPQVAPIAQIRPTERPDWITDFVAAQYRPKARPWIAPEGVAPSEGAALPQPVPDLAQAGVAPKPQVLPLAAAPVANAGLAAPALPTPLPEAGTPSAAKAAPDAGGPAGPPQDATLQVDAAPQIAALPRLRTIEFSDRPYRPERARLEALWQAQTGPARAAPALELARFLTANHLLPEARAFLEAARRDGLLHDPALHAQWRVLGMMLDVLEGQALPATFDAPWEARALWAIAGGADAGGQLSLESAMAQLQDHAEPVVAALLPKLFDQALLRGDLAVAERLLRGAREATRLTEQPIYHLMMGRLALAYEMPEEAFDYFARATNGRDLAAQQARVALADLALARKDPKLLPALRDILVEGVNHWRHDHQALILRARLAQVAEDLGDIPLALDIMGKIRQDHPGTPEAILAHERGALALAAFAVAMRADAISLETYLVTLREVEPYYRLDPVWPIARQALAAALGEAGLHVAAGSELAALQIDLHRIDAPVPPEKQAVEIPLREAEAWIAAFETQRAKIALSRKGLPRFEELQQRYNAAALAADPGVVSSIPASFDAARDLARYARVAREAGLAAEAHQAHQGLAAQNALGAHPAEALQASLTAYGLSKPAEAASYMRHLNATPEGQAFAARGALEATLATPMPDLAPLSQEITSDMLSRAAAAAEAARALLARPLQDAAFDTDALAGLAPDAPSQISQR